jgi:hypothetical protein
MGVPFFLAGVAILTWAIVRGFRSRHARRANGLAARTEPLPRGVRPMKSLRGEPLLERPPLRYHEDMLLILYGIIGLMFGAIGVYLLGAFGVVAPGYTNAPP